MNEQIVQLITELASTGSTAAIWLYGIYVGGSVVKFVIGFGCLFIGIKHICKTAKLFIPKEKR